MTQLARHSGPSGQRDPSRPRPRSATPVATRATPRPTARPAARPTARPTPLLRVIYGRLLRRLRQRQGRTLAEVAVEAGVSIAYLSEIERGLKEPSSEVLAAVCTALGSSIVGLVGAAHVELRDGLVDGTVDRMIDRTADAAYGVLDLTAVLPVTSLAPVPASPAQASEPSLLAA